MGHPRMHGLSSRVTYTKLSHTWTVRRKRGELHEKTMTSLFGIRLLTRVSLVTRSLPQPSWCTLRGFSDATLTSKIFVGRIPPLTTEDELKSKFPSCQMVTIVKDRSTGVSKGFGFVNFSSHKEAKEALNTSVEIGGRTLKLGLANKIVKKNMAVPTKSTTLHVGGLPFVMTEAELISLFPGSTSATLISDHVTGLRKGYGFVQFANSEDAKAGLELNGKVVKGKTLKVDYAIDKSPNTDDLVTRGAGEPSTRLFVGNLSSFTTESSLMKAFDGCVEARIMVNPNTGKHMGFGLVEYRTVEEAKAVFDKPSTIELDGCVLFIDYDSARTRERNFEPSSVLYVGNLSYATTESDLMKAFDGCVKASIAIDPQTGKSMGFSYVEYSSLDEAKAAFDKEVVLDGRNLFISYSFRKSMQEQDLRRGNSRPSSTLFIGNLSFATTKSKLMEAFDGCVEARVMFDDAGQSKGFGYVTYSSVGEAQAVFDKKENIILDGRPLFIDYDEGLAVARRGCNEPSRILFVGSLSYSTTESALVKAFDGCVSATIIFDKTGKSRGFGHVEYRTVDEAKAVFDTPDNIVLDGRSLFIDYVSPRKTRSTSDGSSSSSSSSDSSSSDSDSSSYSDSDRSYSDSDRSSSDSDRSYSDSNSSYSDSDRSSSDSDRSSSDSDRSYSDSDSSYSDSDRSYSDSDSSYSDSDRSYSDSSSSDSDSSYSDSSYSDSDRSSSDSDSSSSDSDRSYSDSDSSSSDSDSSSSDSNDTSDRESSSDSDDDKTK